MNYNDLKNFAMRDLTIGDYLDKEAKDLPRKKAQWSEWLSVLAIECKKKELQLNRVMKERFEYFFLDYNVKLDKKEIREIYLPGDEQIQAAQKEYILAKEKVEFAERTLKSLIGAGFDIRNVIEYRKLLSGIL